MTAYTTSIDGMTKVNPHKDIINLTTFKFLCLFKAKENGIAIKQLINADKKA